MDIQKPKSKQPIPENAKRVFKGVLFDVYQWEQEMFDGTKITFEKLYRPDTVVVIPITEDGQIMLTEEEQPGKEPFLGVPGGRMEGGENPLECAERELLEETGYKAEKYILWHASQPVTKIDWTIFVLIAKNCNKIKEPSLDSGEKISLKFVSFDQFVSAVLGGDFSEPEIVTKVMEAKLDSQKNEEFNKLFGN